jgi:polysaccharide export outer membrane protein
MKPAAALVALALAAPLAALAQSSGQRDLRVGAVRPAESREVLTDGGLRTLSNAQVFAVPSSLAKDYRINPSDVLEVEVLEADNLRRIARVTATGSISLPLIGQIVVAGLTPQEAEERIALRYSEKYLQNPQVSVMVKEFTTERITVEGAVGHPGIFPLTSQMTLLRVLAIVGGFGPIADSSKVLVYRVNDDKVRETHVFDVDKIRAGKLEDPPIKADDLIVVQRDSARAVLKDSLLRDVIDSINPFSILVPH